MRVTVSPTSCIVTAAAVVSGEPVPVTCIPVTNPAVLAIVMVVEPAVGVPVSDTTAGAPQFELIVIVCAPLALPRLAKIDSNAVFDNLHPE